MKKIKLKIISENAIPRNEQPWNVLIPNYIKFLKLPTAQQTIQQRADGRSIRVPFGKVWDDDEKNYVAMYRQDILTRAINKVIKKLRVGELDGLESSMITKDQRETSELSLIHI